MANEAYQVVYLTGPPASGKSTLTYQLEQKIRPMKAFVYSQVLAEYLSSESDSPLSQDSMRKLSGKIISPKTIDYIDNLLVQFVRDFRDSGHIVIDSHAVTKETYGFRVTPFSLKRLRQINPTMIVTLYTEPEIVVDRISANSQGRPQVSSFEADFHCSLQASVALIYAIGLGLPVHFLDSGRPCGELVSQMETWLSKT